MDVNTLYYIVAGGVALILLFYLITIYNNLVSLKNSVKKSWSNIDVLLKQRNSEVPKLVATCKEYMGYEQETLTQITAARSAAMKAIDKSDIPALGQAESAMRLGLGKLFALAENYPDLKANQTFLHLQKRISVLETQISDRREFYNESVNLNNIRIEQFPDVIVAKIFAFKHFDLLKFDTEELKDVDVQALFG